MRNGGAGAAYISVILLGVCLRNGFMPGELAVAKHTTTATQNARIKERRIEAITDGSTNDGISNIQLLASSNNAAMPLNLRRDKHTTTIMTI